MANMERKTESQREGGFDSSTRRSANINDLPDDVLVRVFAMIPCYASVSKVCRRWGTITQEREPDIWIASFEMLGLLPVDESTVMGREFKKRIDMAKDANEIYETLKVSLLSKALNVREKRTRLKLLSEKERQAKVDLRQQAELLLKKVFVEVGGLVVEMYQTFYQRYKSKFCVKDNCQLLWIGERCIQVQMG